MDINQIEDLKKIFLSLSDDQQIRVICLVSMLKYAEENGTQYSDNFPK